MISNHIGAGVGLAPLQNGIVPRGTRVQVFQQIFDVFLVLGTLVGVVVVGYMLYNAYKYRADADVKRGTESNPPTLGELPTGSGGGGKLFVSFTLSAIIVISLIAWTYGALAFVEDPPTPEDTVEVEVVGYQFGWKFIYPNGYQDSTLRVPVDTNVKLSITSEDVFHNIGIPELRVKSDAIPGQTTDTWFVANETGTYMAQCYELCGVGHSYMTAEVKVMPKEEYESWYANTTAKNGTAGNSTAGNGTANNSTAHALGGA